MISVSNLSRRYGDILAVDSVSFNIEKGQIVGLLGHNGAGKTTIMKMLTGYLEPTEGTIEIAGLNLAENRLAVQERLGYLPETSPLYPDMSVVRYLDFVASLRGLGEEGRRGTLLRDTLNRTGLIKVAHQQIGTLSKGYKQRVGVAQALLHNPQILVMDEPTSGLDPSQIHDMRSLIKDLAKESTVLLSTHIMQEVEATCDRVIIISQGKIASDAELSELRASKRLLVELNQRVEAVTPVLMGVSGVKGVVCTGGGDESFSYALDLNDEGGRVAPKVAQALVHKGWELYDLRREVRNLETVFREISAV